MRRIGGGQQCVVDTGADVKALSLDHPVQSEMSDMPGKKSGSSSTDPIFGRDTGRGEA